VIPKILPETCRIPRLPGAVEQIFFFKNACFQAVLVEVKFHGKIGIKKG
jgi:hypothetical protein